MQLRGLYAIADTETIGAARLEAAVQAVLAGGAAMVQYRDKSGATARRSHEAALVVAACRRHDAVSIINDDPALAAAAGADGVHLGGDDPQPRAARRYLGERALVGVSCYDDLDRARAAAAAGADYVAFGRVYPSATKPGGPRAPLALLGRARSELGLPVCAIGGITAERAPEVIAAGADLLAVIGDVFSAADITARAAQYAAVFEHAGRGR